MNKKPFESLNINSAICKIIADYAIQHPDKFYMINNRHSGEVDPLILYLKDGNKVKKIFKYLSVYTLLLMESNKNEWIFYYKLVNNKSDKIIIKKLGRNKVNLPIASAVKKALMFLYERMESDFVEPELIIQKRTV